MSASPRGFGVALRQAQLTLDAVAALEGSVQSGGSAARDSTTSTNCRTTSWRFGWTCCPVSQICSFGSRALA